jgi:hypothetical protein
MIDEQRAQLWELLGYEFYSPTVEPIILGKIRAPAMPLLITSAERGIKRYRRFNGDIAKLFADDQAKRLPSGAAN